MWKGPWVKKGTGVLSTRFLTWRIEAFFPFFFSTCMQKQNKFQSNLLYLIFCGSEVVREDPLAELTELCDIDTANSLSSHRLLLSNLCFQMRWILLFTAETDRQINKIILVLRLSLLIHALRTIKSHTDCSLESLKANKNEPLEPSVNGAWWCVRQEILLCWSFEIVILALWKDTAEKRTLFSGEKLNTIIKLCLFNCLNISGLFDLW